MGDGLFVSSIRHRAVSSAAIFVVGVLAVGSASLAPILARAVEQSVLTNEIRQSPLTELALRVSIDNPPGPLSITPDEVAQTLEDTGLDREYSAPVPAEVTATGALISSGMLQFRAVVGWRPDQCDHGAIVMGGAPASRARPRSARVTPTASTSRSEPRSA
jgi:hypothetical protein